MPVTLSCSSNHNWKRCTWKKIGWNGCAFEYTYYPNQDLWKNVQLTCDSHFKKPDFKGSSGHEDGHENHLCSIVIKPVEFDHAGEYECRLERCKEPKDRGCESNEKGPSSSVKVSVKVPTLKLKISYIIFIY